MLKSIKHQGFGFVAAISLLSASPAQAATILFHETFEGVDTGYYNASCGSHCTHSIQTGVPTAGGGSGINGADEDWYGARFEYPDGGHIHQDVGVQEYGGNSNSTHVGLIEDDAGLMFKVSTIGYENITLSFDWRTFVAGSSDKFVVGYYIGDVTAGLSEEFPGSRTYDLRNASHGGADGPWNWNPINSGNTGDWVELMRAHRSNDWSSENFTLDIAANNQSEIWIAFWLDNGEHDIGKFDNVVVMGDPSAPVPVPAALWLFASGLLGLGAIGRRRS